MSTLRITVVITFSLIIGATALAEPYWVAWEGDDGLLPEQTGWERRWGDRDGEFHGDGAIRTLENGVLTYDDLFDPWVYDYSLREGLGDIDPDPGETFVVEWRLKVDQVGDPWNGGVSVFSDDTWGLGLRFAEDHIWSSFEHVTIPFAPGTYHEYQVRSANMREYTLTIDSANAYEGVFVDVFSASQVSWGAASSGEQAAGIMYWDYFRYGVTPEPSTITSVLITMACCCGRRFRPQ